MARYAFTVRLSLTEGNTSGRDIEIAEGRFGLVRSEAPKFETWADQFLESVQHPNTKRAYKSCVVALKSHFKGLKLSEVTGDRIELFKQARLKAGTGPATINRNLAVLRRMMKLAERQRLISRSPFSEVEFLEERSGRRQPHILTWDEEKRLLAVAAAMLRALIVLLLETGLRIGREALPLRWENVDFLDGAIIVRKSKTLAGRRCIPLSETCKKELLEWRSLAGPEVSPYVFPNMRKATVHLKGVRKPWVKALKAASISYFPIYNLRATFASRLSAAGAPDNMVAGMLGHSSVSIVNTYAKVDEFRGEAIRKLETLRATSVN